MKSKSFYPVVLFILGFGLFMFTRYSTLLPSIHTMLLIAPIFILRFIRTQPKGRGILLTLLGFLLAFNISLWGLFQFDNASFAAYFSLIRSSMLAIAWSIPFMVDRLIYPTFKNHKLLSSLTFPIVFTTLFFLITYDGPFDDGSGTTSTFGYSYGSFAFMQVRSLFGVWILIFIHSWLHAIVNYFWENDFNWQKARKLAILYPVTLGLVFVFGLIKISSSSTTKSETVKTAAIVLYPENGIPINMSTFFDSKKTSPFDQTVSRIKEMIESASNNEAKIVSFQEHSILINDDEEARLKSLLTGFATENDIYMSIAYSFYRESGKGENKQLLISPDGKIQLEYTKRYLLGVGSFGETGVFKKGEERIQTLQTPYGKVAISICKDAGYPRYMRQAANQSVDIMLSPSYDWPKSHSAWYITCAVENGFSFVRPTYNGYSYAADYNGKEIAHMKSDETETGIMYADVPTKGIKTLYSIAGDFFAWLNVIGFLGLIVLKIKK